MGCVLSANCSLYLLYLLWQAILGPISFLPEDVPQLQSEGCSLQVKVSGYQEMEGRLQVALFDAEDRFLKQPYRALYQPVSADTILLVFEDVSPGWYAVAVYQDKNGNQQLDKNLLGWPVEAYGFSNNVQARLGPPDFEQAKFRVRHPSHTISIALH